jgi:hypothetical protein
MNTTRALPAVVFLLAACTSTKGGVAVTSRDSAGITIIDHPAEALINAPQWTTGAPTVTIAGSEGDAVVFSRITSAGRLSDGRIVAVNVEAGASQPILFTKDGKVERLLGRPGGGPGEFQLATIAGILPGDTIVFWDVVGMRLTPMLPDGTPLTSTTITGLSPMTSGTPSGRLADGRLVTVAFSAEDSVAGGGIFRAPTPVIALDAARRKVDTINEVPAAERFMTYETFGGQAVAFPAPVPYGSTSQVIPAGAQLLVTTNEHADIASYSLPWHLQRIVRFHRARLPVDEIARNAYINYNITEIERRSARLGAMKDVLIRHTREAKFPDSMGYYSATLLGADSSLWLAEMRPMSDSTPTHLVVGADGHLRARISLPLDARLLWAGAGEVLIILRDEDDVERLELRPIIKAGD